MSRRLVIASMLCTMAVLTTSPLEAQDKFRIRVDLKEKKVLPDDPTVNLQYEAPGITIDFINDPRAKPPANVADEFQVGAPDLPAYVRVQGQPGKITHGENLASLGSSHVVTFRRCEPGSFNEEGVHEYDARYETDSTLKEWAKNTDPNDDDPRYANHPVKVTEQMCPFAVLNRRWTNSWIVFADESTVSFSIRAYTRKTAEASFWESISQGRQVYSYSVPIYLRNGVFSLRWSAGVAFFDRRNERFALRKIEGDANNVTLDGLDDSSPPYQLNAMAHYAITRAPAIALTAGVGVDVPVKEPSFMVGVSVSAPTISWLDDTYLTFGVAYSGADRLKEKFVGLETLPATTRESDLLERESDFAPFISITYGFAGGEQKFKGVFSGSKK